MYRLVNDIAAHAGDVKAVSVARRPGGGSVLASASRDGSVKVWTLAADGAAEAQGEMREHGGFVNAVAVSAADGADGATLVASGGTDGVVYLYDVSDTAAVGALVGHTENVCFLAFSPEGQLVSCSWDRSAKVWEGGVERGTLQGHSQAVWGACAVSPAVFLTASADKTIRLWQDGRCVRVFLGHTDAVRSVAMLGAPLSDLGDFASVGNDGLLKLWRLSGECTLTISAHASFIYTLSVLGGVVVTAGEDRVAKVWRRGAAEGEGTISCVQSLPVPALSIWSVDIAPSGEIFCGCSDGHIYVFSPAAATAPVPPQAVLDAYHERLAAMQLSRELLAGEADANVLQRPGARAGQTILVRGEGATKAYQWDGQRWDRIGEVVEGGGASGQKVAHAGKEYDFVFDVELEANGPTLKLPYNRGDNPYDCAAKFLADNGLRPDTVGQVVDFLLQNTATRTIESVGGVFDPYAAAPAPPPSADTSRASFAVYREANIDGIAKKLAEYSAAESCKISQEHMQALRQSLAGAKAAPPTASLEECVGAWRAEHLFPLFDALRVIATTRPDTVMASYTGISGRVRSLGGVPSALLTAARMLCNLLGSEDAAPQIIADRDTWKKLVQDCHACPMKDPSVSANLCCGYLQRLRAVSEEKELALLLQAVERMAPVLETRPRSGLAAELEIVGGRGWGAAVLEQLERTKKKIS